MSSRVVNSQHSKLTIPGRVLNRPVMTRYHRESPNAAVMAICLGERLPNDTPNPYGVAPSRVLSSRVEVFDCETPKAVP